MPQDSLWAASARTVGIRFELRQFVGKHLDQQHLTITPLWQKMPSCRDGSVSLEVPDYATWQVPHLIDRAFGQWAGGDAKHVPVVVRTTLRDVLAEYRAGAIG